MQIYVFSQAISPELKRAIQTSGGEELSQDFFPFLERFLEKRKMIPIRAARLFERKEFPSDTLKDVLSRTIDDLPLSTRTTNALRAYLGQWSDLWENPYSILEIVLLKEIDYLRIKNVGRKMQLEVRNALRSLGLDCIDCLSEEEGQQIEKIGWKVRK